jgi:hypothetical protein
VIAALRVIIPDDGERAQTSISVVGIPDATFTQMEDGDALVLIPTTAALAFDTVHQLAIGRSVGCQQRVEFTTAPVFDNDVPGLTATLPLGGDAETIPAGVSQLLALVPQAWLLDTAPTDSFLALESSDAPTTADVCGPTIALTVNPGGGTATITSDASGALWSSANAELVKVRALLHVTATGPQLTAVIDQDLRHIAYQRNGSCYEGQPEFPDCVAGMCQTTAAIGAPCTPCRDGAASGARWGVSAQALGGGVALTESDLNAACDFGCYVDNPNPICP